MLLDAEAEGTSTNRVVGDGLLGDFNTTWVLVPHNLHQAAVDVLGERWVSK